MTLCDQVFKLIFSCDNGSICDSIGFKVKNFTTARCNLAIFLNTMNNEYFKINPYDLLEVGRLEHLLVRRNKMLGKFYMVE